jgi:MFS family permease
MRGLYITAAVTMAGVSSVFALLAALQERYDLPTVSLGWIAGTAFLTALVAQLWLSRYADRGYGGLLLRAGVVASAAGLIWFGLATEVWQFVAARGLLGAGVGMLVPPARRFIVLTAGDKQGEKLGTFYAAYLSGFVFGPPFAAALLAIGDVRLPFLVLGALVALSLLSILRLEMPMAEPEEAGGVDADRRVLRRLLSDRRLIAALLVVISFRYSIGVFEPLWSVHLTDLGASDLWIALSLTGFALPMLLVARAAGRLTDTYGARWASLVPALITVPLMATYGYSPFLWLVMAVAVPHGLMEAAMSPASQAAVANASSKADAGAAQGLGEAAGSAAAAAGAFTAPGMFDVLGAGPAWLIAACVMGCLLVLSWILDGPGPLPSRPAQKEKVS